MKTCVVVLGAGFGGLELTTTLSDALGDAIDIVLIDKGDAFVFGFSKLDVPVNKKTLETSFPGVYAVGDVNGVGTAKAGVFAEGAARVVAAAIIAQLRGGPSPEAYKGAGACYVEFGHNQVGRVDVDFLSGPKPTGTFQEPSEALVAEKASFGSSRIQRWFGQPPPACG